MSPETVSQSPSSKLSRRFFPSSSLFSASASGTCPTCGSLYLRNPGERCPEPWCDFVLSPCSSPCQDLLLWFLSHATGDQALQLLQQLSGLQTQQQAAASLSFRAGTEGGARLCPGDGCRPPGLPTADAEDQVLYEKLSWEQWRLECLVDLLAEMKDSDLPGTFFLLLLQARTTQERFLAGLRDQPGSWKTRARLTLVCPTGADGLGLV